MRPSIARRVMAPFLAPVLIVMAVNASPVPMTPEEEGTALALSQANAVIDAVRQPGERCPAGTEHPVELSTLLESLAPEQATDAPSTDGWNRSLLFWCAGNDYALISHGVDGVADESYADLPHRPGADGDDFVLINDRLESAPRHVLVLVDMGRQKRTM